LANLSGDRYVDRGDETARVLNLTSPVVMEPLGSFQTQNPNTKPLLRRNPERKKAFH